MGPSKFEWEDIFYAVVNPMIGEDKVEDIIIEFSMDRYWRHCFRDEYDLRLAKINLHRNPAFYSEAADAKTEAKRRLDEFKEKNPQKKEG